MNRISVRSLVLVLAVAAGGASAQEYYDDAYGNDDGYAARYDESDYAAQEGYYDDAQSEYAAGPGYDGGQGPAYGLRADAYGDRGAYDVARVLSVDPIVEATRPMARQQCWSEPAPVYAGNYRPAPRRTTGAGAVIGAIIGGALGSTVDDGHRRHRGYGRHRGRDNDGAIVAGAIIGGVIGNGIERQNQYRDPRYSDYRGQPAGYYGGQSVQRCREVSEGPVDRRVAGYRVSYEYAGRRYETVTDYHPGSEIRVRVEVTPEH